MMKQRDFVREEWAKLDPVRRMMISAGPGCSAWDDLAEQITEGLEAGQVSWKRNATKQTAPAYARRLIWDGIKKGWLKVHPDPRKSGTRH